MTKIILISLISILFLLCGVPWIILMFYVSIYFAIPMLLIGVLGYLLVREENIENNEFEG